MRNDLPRGTVTFLFTDIEGSTRLLHSIGAERWAEALAEHRRVLREAFTSRRGVEVDTQGDALFVAFPSASDAVEAALAAQEGLARGLIRVRMGLHTGEPTLTDEGYVGIDVHAGARIAACGHGGQVLLSSATVALAGDGFPFTDLGEHRLKDIAVPVWIYQLGNAAFPPLKSLNNTNLPTPASSFLGRERELEEAEARLAEARLLTVTGPGGAGKTRFAIELASRQISGFPNGVFWVPLSPLADPRHVVQTVAQVLGSRDHLEQLIGQKRMLLLLDNLEHVIESAPDLSGLLAACPNLTLLVTSRELLRIQGEMEYELGPLADEEGVRLFCERADEVASDAIGELCRRLDGLPLAIELAAARRKVLTPEQLLARLGQRLDLLRGGRDADPRHATLRATIQWSSELLTGQERALFRHLSVFAGGCTLEAAEHVCMAGLEELESLLDKSLLRLEADRYRMLETVREFALELLKEDDSEKRDSAAPRGFLSPAG